MPKTLRDLFTGTPVHNPTLREVAAEQPDWVAYGPEDPECISVMPGDEGNIEDHPTYPKAVIDSYRRRMADMVARAEERIANPPTKPQLPDEIEEDAQVVFPYSGPRI